LTEGIAYESCSDFVDSICNYGIDSGNSVVTSGKIAFAGIVWAATAILSCIALRIEKYRKQKNSVHK
jgi:hypothetical protein